MARQQERVARLMAAAKRWSAPLLAESFGCWRAEAQRSKLLQVGMHILPERLPGCLGSCAEEVCPERHSPQQHACKLTLPPSACCAQGRLQEAVARWQGSLLSRAFNQWRFEVGGGAGVQAGA